MQVAPKIKHIHSILGDQGSLLVTGMWHKKNELQKTTINPVVTVLFCIGHQ